MFITGLLEEIQFFVLIDDLFWIDVPFARYVVYTICCCQGVHFMKIDLFSAGKTIELLHFLLKQFKSCV